MTMDHEHEHEPVSYGTYFVTWFSLLVLTALTVTVAGMHLGTLSILAALVIACIKATIVLFFFMHLRSESKLLHTMLALVVMILTIFIGLTFTDTLFR